jgi:hypothetical protein
MFENITKFAKLTGRQKRLFWEAVLTLGMMRAAILTVSFKRLTRTLHHSKQEIVTETPRGERLQMAKEIGKAIDTAAKHTPWESACLAQALTAHRMLRKRGIPGVFYLGVMRDGTAEEKMKAHAWSKCGEIVVTGGGYEGFAVLSAFAWEGV